MKQGSVAIKHDSKILQKNFIKVFIDDKECYATEGESILNVARNHGINIPTLCDLKKLTPTGACRMCVVEEENGNIIASCKSFVSAQARFYTKTEKLQKYRNQIMSFLCINHPLECGVCDKSGECELQDRVLESKVCIQPFFAIQKQNDYVNFHNKVYNEALCIMCERCARTCNEYVGNSVLSVLAGGFHSKIGIDFNAYCEDCDECVSVCPTGAMFSTRFTYTSNAWELEKHQSHCIHCSLRCPLCYEVKHNIDSKKEVYRITNEAHINQLCHAGRHNFLAKKRDYVMEKQDFLRHDTHNSISLESNSNLGRDSIVSSFILENVLDCVSALRLGTNVTNEEAFLSNLVAQKANKKLYCNEAFHYKKFSDICKYYVGSANMEALQNLDNNHVVITLGSYLYDELPVLRSDLAKAALKKGTKNIWINTIAEERFQSDISITYEVGSELAISALLLSLFETQMQNCIKTLESIPNEEHKLLLLKSTLEWLKDQDIAYIMAESNVSEYEIESLRMLCMQYKPLCNQAVQKSSIKILVGQDFYLSKHYKVIAQILSVISICHGDCEIIPLCYDNIHAIATLCELSYDNGEYDNVLAIRTNAEYTISPQIFTPFVDSKSSGHIDIIPLQFMEGSYIDIYHNLVKLYPSFTNDSSISDNEKDLLDVVRDYLGLDCEYIIQITEMLPFIQDVKKDFDSLQLKTQICFMSSFLSANVSLQEYPEIVIYEGSGIFIYKASPSGNLSFYRSEYNDTSLFHNGKKLHGILRVSKQFCVATKLQDNAVVRLQINDKSIDVRVMQTSFMKGMVSVLVSDSVIDSTKYFDYKSIEV